MTRNTFGPAALFRACCEDLVGDGMLNRQAFKRELRRLEMAHKGQVGEQKGGSMGGKATDMKTVKDVACGKGK